MSPLTEQLLPPFLTLMTALPILIGIYYKREGKLTTERLCTLILVCGLVLRLSYISYTDEYTRQHDLGYFYEPNDYHGGYILYILDHARLPQVDPREHWQYYHPPLHHIICAAVLSVLRFFGIDYVEYGPRILQLFTTAYSFIFSLLASKTMKRIGIGSTALAVCTAVVSFHPTLIILSGSLNNDVLSAALGMAAVYFTVRFAKERRMRDIVFAALTMGFGMITKLTVGLLAPAIAAVFITVLVKHRSEWKALIVRYIVFGAICVPIGLSWSIRNFVKFGMPPNYVLMLDEYTGQYIDVPPLKRLFDFSLYQFASPFTQWEWNGDKYNEFNPVIALLKNAMFDEETFFRRSITLQSVCTLLFFAGAAVAVLSVLAVVLLWRRKSAALENKLLITIIFAVIFGNYIVFCINYPQVCTQNMRYCVPLIFSGTAALGYFLQSTDGSSGKYKKFAAKAAFGSMSAMCALSLAVYTVMMFYELTEIK